MIYEPSDDQDNLEAWQLEVQLDAAMVDRSYELVLPLAERLLEIQDAKLGPTHEKSLRTVARLAEGYIELAQWERTGELLDRISDVSVLLHLATALGKQGRLDEAERYTQRALRIARDVYGSEHTVVATCHSILAHLAKRRKDWDHALEHAVEAFKIRSSHMTREPEHFYQDLVLVGEIFTKVGEYEEACKSFRMAVEVIGAAPGDQSLKMAWALLLYGRAAMADKKPDDAIPPLKGALEFYQNAYGETDTRLIDPIHELGKAYQAAEHFDEAEEVFLRLRRLYQAAFPEKGSDQAVPLGLLGELAHQRKDYARAAAYLEEALVFAVAEFGEDSVRLHVLLDRVAEARLAEGNLERAKELSEWQIRVMLPHLPNEDEPALLPPVRRMADIEIRRLKGPHCNEEELKRLLPWVLRLMEVATARVQAETAEINARKARESGAS